MFDHADGPRLKLTPGEPMLKPLTAEEKAAHLRAIAHEAARLRDLAKLADAGMLAFLLENVLHDARAEPGARGFPQMVRSRRPTRQVR